MRIYLEFFFSQENFFFHSDSMLFEKNTFLTVKAIQLIKITLILQSKKLITTTLVTCFSPQLFRDFSFRWEKDGRLRLELHCEMKFCIKIICKKFLLIVFIINVSTENKNNEKTQHSFFFHFQTFFLLRCYKVTDFYFPHKKN